MASSIMKKAVQNIQTAQKASAPAPAPATVFTPHRSAILKNIVVEHWLSDQVKEHKKDKATSDATKAKYAQVATTLESTRAQPGEPVNIEQIANTKNTFYVYRAATRWSALERGKSALRSYRNAKTDAEKKAAYAVMLTAAADLARYPADAMPGLPSARLADLGIVLKDPSEFKPTGVKGKSDKLKDAQAIQKIDGWRSLLFARLVDLKSPWIDQAAVASLTGCRPAEVSSVRIEQVGGALVITIPGVKVSDTKGQPFRKFTIKADAGPEFAHLLAKTAQGGILLSSAATPSAFSEALKRAGKQVFGDKAPPMTGYVYRHALACDMKADGASRDEIASALGHAVTKTQSHYGRASGGKKGARVFQVEAERPIKQTHGTGFATKKNIAPVPVAPVFTSPSFGGFAP